MLPILPLYGEAEKHLLSVPSRGGRELLGLRDFISGTLVFSPARASGTNKRNTNISQELSEELRSGGTPSQNPTLALVGPPTLHSSQRPSVPAEWRLQQALPPGEHQRRSACRKALINQVAGTVVTQQDGWPGWGANHCSLP